MVLDARIFYYFSIAGTIRLSFNTSPLFIGQNRLPFPGSFESTMKPAHRSKPYGTVPLVYITAALSNCDIERRRFIHPVYSATWIDSPRIYIYIYTISYNNQITWLFFLSFSHDVNPISPSRMRFLEREILTDKKGLMNRSRSGTTRSCCSEYT